MAFSIKFAYFCGYFVGFVVGVVLEAFLTGGVAAVKELAQLFKAGVARGSRGIRNLGKRSLDSMKTFAKFFNDLFRQATKDPKALFEKFKQWIKDIIQAVKKELGLVDEVIVKTRKATKLDIEELAKVRQFFKAGKKKNVAFTRGEVGGKKFDLWSRSGGEKGQKFDNFNPIDPQDYFYKGPLVDYIHHTEQKQKEYLYKMFKNNKNVIGKIEIVSDLKICDNCYDIISKFEKDFPNVEVTRVWVREVLD